MAHPKPAVTDYAAATLAAFEKRLGKEPELRVKEVSYALNTTEQTVLAHIECGNIFGWNKGVSTSRPTWTIARQSVVDFYRRRLGLAVEPGK